MNKTLKVIFILTLFLAFNFVGISPVSALSISVHVPEKYTDVQAGERFYFEVEVMYPENPSRKDLRIVYEIKKDDEVLAQSKVLKAMETQASFMDFIVIPESAKGGLHMINVKVADYDNLDEEASASFQVVGNSEVQQQTYFLILFGMVGLIGFLVLIQLRTRR